MLQVLHDKHFVIFVNKNCLKVTFYNLIKNTHIVCHDEGGCVTLFTFV